MGGCVALLETGLRREASSLLPPSCSPLSTSWRHTPANAVTGPTNRDAPQGAHENLPELSSKTSSPRNTSTSNYITPIQQCMSKAQTNKPITRYVLLELFRQSAVTPTYQCGLGGLAQQGYELCADFSWCDLSLSTSSIGWNSGLYGRIRKGKMPLAPMKASASAEWIGALS